MKAEMQSQLQDVQGLILNFVSHCEMVTAALL